MHSAALLLSTGLLAAAIPQAPAKLPKGVYELPLRRINDNDAYGIDVNVGTPPQKVTLLIDTGSNTYSVESPYDIYCQEGMCKETGVFDNRTSSTSEYATDGFRNVVSNLGGGDVLKDNLSIGDNSFEDMLFGYITEHDRNTTHQLAALAGLSLQCGDEHCNSTRSLTQALYDKGYIKKRAYSVFLGPADSSVPGQLVMGGIDKAKRQGPVYKHKLVDPREKSGGGVIGEVVMGGLSVRQTGEDNVDYTYEGNDKNVLWDTGSPHWWAPTPIFRSVTRYFGLPNTTDLFDGRLEVDCKYRKPTDDKLVVILDGGDELHIPMWQLLNVRDNGKCYLDMLGLQGAYGDSFVRSLYLTYDYEEMTIEVSMAKYTTDSDIVAIE